MTEETANVLFRRAKWLRLHTVANNIASAYNGSQIINLGGKEITVCRSAPTLVLFEWPEKGEGKESHPLLHSPNFSENKAESKADPLHTGFLIIELYFHDRNVQVSLDHLLEMNERFRYWQQPFNGHELRMKTLLGEPKEKDTAALYFDRWLEFLKRPLIDRNDKQWHLFPHSNLGAEDSNWGSDAKEYVCGKQKSKRGCVVYADNRAFVWTCALMEDGAKALHDKFPDAGKRAADKGYWIKLLNVDMPGRDPQVSNQATEFEKQWAEDRTYHRWEEYGTYYGFSYQSGAMLGPPETEPPLWKHFGQMYFDQFLLLFYLRIVLFRFSTELSQISADARSEKSTTTEWQVHFEELRWAFTLFTNLYQFPLISNQQQGLEMYALARKSMDIDELFKEIKEEVHSSHDYLLQRHAQEQTRIATRLTVVATVGLIIALAISSLSTSTSPSDLLDKVRANPSQWGSFALVLLAFCLFLFLLIFFSVDLSRFLNRLAGIRSNRFKR